MLTHSDDGRLRSSETLVLTKATRSNIPEHFILQTQYPYETTGKIIPAYISEAIFFPTEGGRKVLKHPDI
jgi:hypothetical protein